MDPLDSPAVWQGVWQVGNTVQEDRHGGMGLVVSGVPEQEVLVGAEWHECVQGVGLFPCIPLGSYRRMHGKHVFKVGADNLMEVMARCVSLNLVS